MIILTLIGRWVWQEIANQADAGRPQEGDGKPGVRSRYLLLLGTPGEQIDLLQNGEQNYVKGEKAWLPKVFLDDEARTLIFLQISNEK